MSYKDIAIVYSNQAFTNILFIRILNFLKIVENIIDK